MSSDQVTQGFAQSGLRNSEDGDGTASAGNLFLNSRKFKRTRVFQLAWEDMRVFQAVSQTTLAKSRLNKTNINSLNKIIVCFKGYDEDKRGILNYKLFFLTFESIKILGGRIAKNGGSER